MVWLGFSTMVKHCTGSDKTDSPSPLGLRRGREGPRRSRQLPRGRLRGLSWQSDNLKIWQSDNLTIWQSAYLTIWQSETSWQSEFNQDGEGVEGSSGGGAEEARGGEERGGSGPARREDCKNVKCICISVFLYFCIFVFCICIFVFVFLFMYLYLYFSICTFGRQESSLTGLQEWEKWILIVLCLYLLTFPFQCHLSAVVRQ